jgi:hypothetical protein
MDANRWLESTNHALSDGTHAWLRQLGAALIILVLGLLLVTFPARGSQAAVTAVRTGLPDGNRATGIYTLDGGYGLGETIYADLVAKLLAD